MKHFILAFLMVFSFAFAANAQTEKPKEMQKKEVKAQADEIVVDMADNENGPVMEFSSMEVNYGEIEQNSDKVRYLEFTNTGNEPLIISSCRGSCGCTVPDWPKNPIMPGQTDKIKVSYATNRLGKINKTITITTNEGGKPHVVKVLGNVSKKAEALPEKEATGFGG